MTGKSSSFLESVAIERDSFGDGELLIPKSLCSITPSTIEDEVEKAMPNLLSWELLDSEKAERIELQVLPVLLGGNRIRPLASGSDLAEFRNPIKR